MTTHLTLRMAWHDNNWNGKVCSNPAKNVYCNGTHSLLSARIERNKKIDTEEKHAGEDIDVFENYIPPCYWSCNAFSSREYNIEIEHPFENISAKPVKEKLKPYSVFTWPFRLSFNHKKEKKRKEGKYPSDLENRIKNFFRKFEPGNTIVFFYLNYDNPISADERKYVLLGCSLLTGIDKNKYYNIEKSELRRLRRGEGMKNLPTIMWAAQLHHDYENWGILLPYKDYLKRIEEFPEEEDKLKEMRVLIDEDSIVPNFKYVAEELDEDKCLYLLYKIRRSIKVIEDHGFVDITREKKVIEKLIQKSWERRGLYPSLPRILDIIADIQPDEEPIGISIVSKLRREFKSDTKLLDFIFNLMSNRNEDIPNFLEDISSDIDVLRRNISDYGDRIGFLKKLCLFELTIHQLKKIIFQKDDPFKKSINHEDIVRNPYLLAENYVPEESDLDNPEILDGIIDVFKIDIGMLPDRRYVKRFNIRLQDLTHRSPERLRAIIVDYLKKIGQEGDCYAVIDDVYESILSYPLFYREEQNVNKTDLISETGRYYVHFKERISIEKNKNRFFFYLKEVRYAEELVRKVILRLIERREWNVDTTWVKHYVDEQVEILEQRIPDFEKKIFKRERERLFANVLRTSFYIISGKPGSGKTFALKKIIERIRTYGEQVTLLAPTGKATLSLKEQTGFKGAQTIDMFLYKLGYSQYLDDFENIILKPDVKKQRIDNLIIDETSMVNLKKLTILFSLINLEGPKSIKRIILVGDEQQLPPIGLGKPFVDIINFIKFHDKYSENYIRLKTNCRQEYDRTILALAEVFGERNRYYEEVLNKISAGGQISTGFNVELWKTPEELCSKIDKCLERLIIEEARTLEEFLMCECKAEYVNILFGLYRNGFVKRNSIKTLTLDNLQLLSPYRAGYYGTLGTNEFFKEGYREKHFADDIFFKRSPFNHADKIIRVNNWYVRKYGMKRLKLSNGSIGIINNKRREGRHFRRYFFVDQDDPLPYIDNDENFELAYAITIHKSQGSDFKNVFLIIPKKVTLLSKELLYTALTRSRYRVTLFMQETDEENPLEVARKRSFVLARNTSIFEAPDDYKKIYHPDKDVHVRSKIEYILYTALKSEGLMVEYENELPLKNRIYSIHPDFTIEYNGKTYYWEHLGRLDIENYSEDWSRRKQDYITNGLFENLITTDDLGGVDKEKILDIIHDIKRGNLAGSKDERFSKHHYLLYKQ